MSRNINAKTIAALIAHAKSHGSKGVLINFSEGDITSDDLTKINESNINNDKKEKDSDNDDEGLEFEPDEEIEKVKINVKNDKSEIKNKNEITNDDKTEDKNEEIEKINDDKNEEIEKINDDKTGDKNNSSLETEKVKIEETKNNSNPRTIKLQKDQTIELVALGASVEFSENNGNIEINVTNGKPELVEVKSKSSNQISKEIIISIVDEEKKKKEEIEILIKILTRNIKNYFENYEKDHKYDFADYEADDSQTPENYVHRFPHHNLEEIKNKNNIIFERLIVRKFYDDESDDYLDNIYKVELTFKEELIKHNRYCHYSKITLQREQYVTVKQRIASSSAEGGASSCCRDGISLTIGSTFSI